MSELNSNSKPLSPSLTDFFQPDDLYAAARELQTTGNSAKALTYLDGMMATIETSPASALIVADILFLKAECHIDLYADKLDYSQIQEAYLATLMLEMHHEDGRSAQLVTRIEGIITAEEHDKLTAFRDQIIAETRNTAANMKANGLDEYKGVKAAQDICLH